MEEEEELVIRYLPVRNVLEPSLLNLVYASRSDLYWTDDWSPESFIHFAKAGFICVASEHPDLGPILIPEMQTAYAIMDWGQFHLSRSMKRWLKSPACTEPEYRLESNCDPEEVMDGIARAHGEKNWLNPTYMEMVLELVEKEIDPDFEIITPGLVDKNGKLVAGELGYRTGKIYTSLTGYFDRANPAYRNTGTLQLLLLSEWLRRKGFVFWNLGHPQLEYKTKIGATVFPRTRFLKRWYRESGMVKTP